MFKVSMLNPKDKTLDEIHQIQERIYEEDKGLSREKEVERFNESIKDFAKSFAYNPKIVTLEGLKK